MGIGKISKTLQPTATIYSYKYYNRYTYKCTTDKGTYAQIYNDVNNMDLPQEYQDIITETERKIFYGRGHIKRGSSFTSFPVYPHDPTELILVFDYITRTKGRI